jgi:hypothetical protein
MQFSSPWSTPCLLCVTLTALPDLHKSSSLSLCNNQSFQIHWNVFHAGVYAETFRQSYTQPSGWKATPGIFQPLPTSSGIPRGLVWGGFKPPPKKKNTKLQLSPEPLTRGPLPPDPHSLSSAEFVEPPQTKFLGTPLPTRTTTQFDLIWFISLSIDPIHGQTPHGCRNCQDYNKKKYTE